MLLFCFVFVVFFAWYVMLCYAMLWYLIKRQVKYRNLFKYFFLEWFLLKLFLSCFNFITQSHWIASNNPVIFTNFTTTCSRIANIMFFAHMIFFFRISKAIPTFIIIPLLIWVTFLTIKFASTFAWYTSCLNQKCLFNDLHFLMVRGIYYACC